ncbi:hypothetical protein [Amycolatopsis jiangsuensis]|uniref:Nucleotide exchange factor GrpE n=1 Tax=Amycolatopsis jiangsuensis TaxID=1181879 RepID=A0A840IZY3_9PSEU|nr:hypothetical protein [Amycolatopsis jiangsuensis]MBB4688421.1 hypothetical protein [Amycolatopsis jiangsuensis]
MNEQRNDARQRRYHKEFRIAEPGLHADDRARLRDLLAQLSAVRQAVPERTGPELSESDLAAAATALWKARRRLDGAQDRVARQAGRLLRASHDALHDAGVEVQDHDGAPFDTGLALEVLLFQDQPGLDMERVVETVRPSVYLMQRRIQMGQVVVGRPAGQAGEETDA